MSNWSNETFAKNLQSYIEKTGKTQREVAEVIGVSAPTFNEWIKGKKMPRMGKVEKLANYFGCEKSDLIEDKEKKPDVGDELSENVKALLEFAKTVPEEQASMVLRVMKSILGDD